MRTYHSFLISLSLLLFSCQKEETLIPSSCTGDDFSNHASDSLYSALLDSYVVENNLPGAILAVDKGGEEFWAGATGMANLSIDSRMQTCTPFRTGSISKMFTAALILQLKDQGLLSLDDKLVDHLPEVADHIPGASEITIRMLLNHSSGLPQPSDDNLTYQLQLLNQPEMMAGLGTDEKLKNYIYGKKLVATPGTSSYYSNPGYWLLGQVIRKITGQTYNQVLAEQITGPLGLTGTYLAVADAPSIARGYGYKNGALTELTLWDRSDSDGDPAGGIVSTAEELCIFFRALFTGNLLEPETLEEMKFTQSFDSCEGGKCPYGLGVEIWDNYQVLGYGKNGSLPGVDANCIYFPEKNTTVVVFTNFGQGSRKDWVDEILQ